MPTKTVQWLVFQNQEENVYSILPNCPEINLRSRVQHSLQHGGHMTKDTKVAELDLQTRHRHQHQERKWNQLRMGT